MTYHDALVAWCSQSTSRQFERDLKLMSKRGKRMSKMLEAMELLRLEEPLPERFEDHKLSGDYIGRRECPIESDWLLVYRYIQQR